MVEFGWKNVFLGIVLPFVLLLLMLDTGPAGGAVVAPRVEFSDGGAGQAAKWPDAVDPAPAVPPASAAGLPERLGDWDLHLSARAGVLASRGTGRASLGATCRPGEACDWWLDIDEPCNNGADMGVLVSADQRAYHWIVTCQVIAADSPGEDDLYLLVFDDSTALRGALAETGRLGIAVPLRGAEIRSYTFSTLGAAEGESLLMDAVSTLPVATADRPLAALAGDAI
jgi:hypothetical protein